MPSGRDLRALIRRRRATRPNVRRTPVQAYPENIEREYRKAMIALMTEVHARVKALVAKTFRADEDDGATIGETIEGIRVDTFRTLRRSNRSRLLAQGIGGKVHRFATNAVAQQVKAVIGVNPLASAPAMSPELLSGFVAENVKLIRSVPERYFADVQKIVTESGVMGRRAEQVSALVEERYEVSKSNASRIARDQIGKLNAEVTQTRQRDLGITGYIWRTVGDERVRDEHDEREGESFSWDDPPEGGHPGEDIMCRCRAEPDLSALLGS